MTNLQHPAELSRGRDQPFGLRRGLGHRLLDQHVRTVFHECARDVEMRRRRRDDADGIDLAEQRPIIAVGRYLQLFGDPRGGLRLAIHHPDQCAILEQRVFLGVETSQIAHPDHSRSDFLHVTAIMPKGRGQPRGQISS